MKNVLCQVLNPDSFRKINEKISTDMCRLHFGKISRSSRTSIYMNKCYIFVSIPKPRTGVVQTHSYKV